MVRWSRNPTLRKNPSTSVWGLGFWLLQGSLSVEPVIPACVISCWQDG